MAPVSLASSPTIRQHSPIPPVWISVRFVDIDRIRSAFFRGAAESITTWTGILNDFLVDNTAAAWLIARAWFPPNSVSPARVTLMYYIPVL